MDDILISKILETEKESEKIISNAKNTASHLIENYTAHYNLEKKEIERKYDDSFITKQEQIKKDLDEEFKNKLSITKSEVDKIKIQSMNNYDNAINILFSGVTNDGNS
ncbi:MAG: hypothetical protein IJX17_02035 [Clostridia bacterium]|nr:hypothetical protein [Clostridia bacterium]